MSFRRLGFLVALFASAHAAAALADDGLTILPERLAIARPGGVRHLLVQEKSGGEPGRQVVEGVEWTSSDPETATVKAGVVTALRDGKVTISAAANGRTAKAEVVVTGQGAGGEIGFRNDVEPILAKLGCNSGACHGALAGKGGFRLSLRGYDPMTDHFNIVKQDRGRRIDLGDPGASLVLAKPSGAIAHKGGIRFTTASPEYRVISQWIAAGAPAPSETDAAVERIEIRPLRSIERVGSVRRMTVAALYTDGAEADVTQHVKWSSADETVCRVDDDGAVQIIGPGEGAIVAWYAGKLAIARVTSPYPAETPAGNEIRDARKARNYIDELIDKQLARLNLPASPDCTDAEFLRRATIDVIGRLPTAEEAKAFLADAQPNRRDALIDKLLAGSDYADYWTYKWSDLLMLNGTRLRPQALKTYYDWIHKQVADNTPWDKFVAAIVTASGESTENGPSNFYALSQSPEDMTENVCQAFLGLSIGCAKCHNHPLEKWTNDQYYGMASLFARVKAKGWGGEGRDGDGKRTLYAAESGEVVQPRTGKPRQPAPLDSAPLEFNDPADRRIALARWLTAGENPYFARSIANRVWANFFGVGLVEKVDDMRVSNPASNEALLSALADDLIKSKFDLKALMKRMLQSNAYARTSRALAGNRSEKRFYSRYYPRRLQAEVLHDAIVQATEVPSKFDAIAFPGADKQKTDFYPVGTRAVQLYDSAVENYFLQTFGRNPRRIVCECERSNEPTVVQALHLSNGDTLNEKLHAPGNRVEKLIRLRKEGMSIEALIDEIYLVCLARYPSAAERKGLVGLVPPQGDANERETVEDLFWGIMTSREFVFNH